MILNDSIVSQSDPKTSMWKGHPLTRSMGHSFEDNMNCKWCKVGWTNHQKDPNVCKKSVTAMVIPIKPNGTG